MIIKYLVELYDDNYENRLIDRFYFDNTVELQDWFDKNIETIFNNGFIHKKIVLSIIEKGSENNE